MISPDSGWTKGKIWPIMSVDQPLFRPLAGSEITDFQRPDKMPDTIKYLLDILKIH